MLYPHYVDNHTLSAAYDSASSVAQRTKKKLINDMSKFFIHSGLRSLMRLGFAASFASMFGIDLYLYKLADMKYCLLLVCFFEFVPLLLNYRFSLCIGYAARKQNSVELTFDHSSHLHA